jgi:lysophospholipase L1-like esterase
MPLRTSSASPILWLLSSTLAGLSSSALAGPPRALRYVALGDSFTIGTGTTPDRSFPAHLAELWQSRHPVELTNLGVNGYSTQEILDLELPKARALRPDFVTLAVGANDIVRGREPQEYRSNVRAILGQLRALGLRGHRIVVIPQPDWSGSPVAAAFGDPASLAARIELYNSILHEETIRAGAEWVDLFPLMHRQAEQGLVASDGLHPTAAAYAAWAEALAKLSPD